MNKTAPEPVEPDYRTWLETYGTHLTEEQYAGHMNLLRELKLLTPALSDFASRHDHGGSFPDAILTREQRAVLNNAARILKRLEYPLAFLDVRAPKPMLKLPKKR